jgi:hypothetical protein
MCNATAVAAVAAAADSALLQAYHSGSIGVSLGIAGACLMTG